MVENLDLMIKSHTSQFNLSLPIPVQKCCCGIASAIFVLRYFKVNLETSDTDLALDFMDYGQYTQPIIGVQFANYPSRTFPVLLSKSEKQADIEMSIEQAKTFLDVYSDKLTTIGYDLEIIYPNHQKYTPAFLMRNGTDVRGLSRWLNMQGLKTKVYEYREKIPQIDLEPNHKIITNKEAFVSMFESELLNGNSLLISSVIQSKFLYTKEVDIVRDIRFTGTHVVVAKKGRGENFVTYADPAYKNGNLGVKQIRLEDFLEAMIGDDKRSGHFLEVSR